MEDDEEGQWLLIAYVCPECEWTWQEEWSCACDSECPHCGLKDVQAASWQDANG